MTETLHILSVGPAELDNMVRDVLSEWYSRRLSFARSRGDLYAIPISTLIDIAIIHETICEHELQDVARYIRHRWPRARILVIRDEADSLESVLYDDLVPPGLVPEALFATVAWLNDRALEP